MRPPDQDAPAAQSPGEAVGLPERPVGGGNAPLGPGTIALTLLLVALWGGTPVAIKYSVATIPPIAVAAIRFAMAAVFMYVWCRLEGTSLTLRKGQLRPCLILGGLLCVQITLFTLGVQLSIASHGTLFINTFIFWVAAIEHFVTRTDRLSPIRLGGLVLAAAGVLLILTMQDSARERAELPAPVVESSAATSVPQPSVVDSAPPQAGKYATLLGDILLLASGMLLGVKIICTKQATQVVEPGKLIFWHDVIGTALMAVWSLLTERVDPAGFTLPATLGLLYQGVVVAGFCFGVQARLLRKHSASQLSVYSFATPLFGILLAVLMLGERLSPWLLVSGAAVATGIWLVNRKPGTATPSAA
ncbi:MAG: DMT family transporter [Planctomycetaceae bacterium]|nr:DMT family transporter [Planctomycetaceae bacterium]